MKKNGISRGKLPPIKCEKFLNVVKLTLLFLLVSHFNVFSSVSSQYGKFDLEFTNAKLIHVLQNIEEQSEFRFAYSSQLIGLNNRVSLKIKNKDIHSVMTTLFDGTEISYEIVDRNIMLTSRKELKAGQQKRIVTGIVTDKKGDPIPGVSVVIKGTLIGLTTDIDGKYSIEVPAGTKVLQFSFVGMKSQEIVIEGKSQINVMLMDDVHGLDEVVVVGYGVQKKVNLTGSVATVKSEKLTSVPVANAAQTLAGKLPGLVVQESTGRPGSTPSISIRGFGTPLYIVDGVEQENYHNIDPNEIESFNILKDASAAIYGAKAGNGVVLITTKRGVKDKSKINYNSSLTYQTPTMFPDYLNSWELATSLNEIEDYRKELAQWQGTAYGQKYDTFTDQQLDDFKNGVKPSTNWYKEVIKNWAPMQSHNLNINGGSDNITYFLSVGYMHQDGIFKSGSNYFERYNVRSNIDAKVAQNLSVSLDLSYRHSSTHDAFSGQDTWVSFGSALPWHPATFPDPDKVVWSGWDARSPVNLIDHKKTGYAKDQRGYLVGALSLKYDVPFIKGLSVKARVNAIGDSRYKKNFARPFSTWLYDEDNDTYTKAATENQDYLLVDRRDEATNIVCQGFLEYDRAFGDHDVKALFVAESNDRKSNYLTGDIKGFISPAVDQIFAGNSETKSLNGSAYEEGNLSYVGRFNYAYKGKYLLEATLRADASSRFHSDARWGFFPSASLGWRFSEEEFVKNEFSFIDNAKLRLSYSQTGYDRNAIAYQYLSSYSFKSQFVVDGFAQKGLRSDGLVNQDVTWEKLTSYNGGLDMTFCKGLIGFGFDYFYRLREDVLGTRVSTLPNTFGASLPQENINSTDNRGFELIVTHRNKINDFEYSVSGNMSWTRSKYVKWEEQEYDDPDEERLYKKSGRWTDIWYGYKTDGYFQTQEEIENTHINYDLNDNRTIVPGLPKYVDMNNDSIINWRDQVAIGRSGSPKVIFGLNFDMKYKGFDFNMMWQGATNFDVNLADRARYPQTIASSNFMRHVFEERWTPENPNAEFPRLTDLEGGYIGKTSDLFLKSAGYIRLKNMTIGYSIPKTVLNKIGGIDRVRLYLAGYNMLTFNKLKKYQIDSETGGSFLGRYYPQYKSFSFGVNITLQ